MITAGQIAYQRPARPRPLTATQPVYTVVGLDDYLPPTPSHPLRRAQSSKPSSNVGAKGGVRRPPSASPFPSTSSAKKMVTFIERSSDLHLPDESHLLSRPHIQEVKYWKPQKSPRSVTLNTLELGSVIMNQTVSASARVKYKGHWHSDHKVRAPPESVRQSPTIKSLRPALLGAPEDEGKNRPKSAHPMLAHGNPLQVLERARARRVMSAATERPKSDVSVKSKTSSSSSRPKSGGGLLSPEFLPIELRSESPASKSIAPKMTGELIATKWLEESEDEGGLGTQAGDKSHRPSTAATVRSLDAISDREDSDDEEEGSDTDSFKEAFNYHQHLCPPDAKTTAPTGIFGQQIRRIQRSSAKDNRHPEGLPPPISSRSRATTHQTTRANTEKYAIEQVALRRLKFVVEHAEAHPEHLTLVDLITQGNVPPKIIQQYFGPSIQTPEDLYLLLMQKLQGSVEPVVDQHAVEQQVAGIARRELRSASSRPLSAPGYLQEAIALADKKKKKETALDGDEFTVGPVRFIREAFGKGLTIHGRPMSSAGAYPSNPPAQVVHSSGWGRRVPVVKAKTPNEILSVLDAVDREQERRERILRGEFATGISLEGHVSATPFVSRIALKKGHSYKA